MAYDAFIKLDGIDGESTDENHKGWVDLLSFSWGASAHGAGAGGDGGGASEVRVRQTDFTFVKVTDSASPKIFSKCCTGAHFPAVILTARKAGGGQDYLKIVFSDVLVSSFNEGGNTGTDPQPLESISFAFTKIDIQAAAPDGTVSEAGFDFKTNKPLLPPGGGV